MKILEFRARAGCWLGRQTKHKKDTINCSGSIQDIENGTSTSLWGCRLARPPAAPTPILPRAGRSEFSCLKTPNLPAAGVWRFFIVLPRHGLSAPARRMSTSALRLSLPSRIDVTKWTSDAGGGGWSWALSGFELL